MTQYMRVIKKTIRKTVAFLKRQWVYLLISYILLFATFLMEIRDSYKQNSAPTAYQYFDFVVEPSSDDSILMHSSPDSVK